MAAHRASLRKGWLVTLLMAGVVMVFAPLMAQATAQTFTVNATTDTGAGSGTSGDILYCVIQANANPGSTIQFSDSLLGQTITLSTTNVIVTNTTITGPGANLLTISGGNALQVFQIGTDTFFPAVSISGLTIANGHAGSGNLGGGILNWGTLTVSNCIFSGNTAADYGGGISQIDNTLIVNNSTFSGNTATYGGGIALFGGGVAVSNSTFSGNSATNGGGIFAGTGVTVTNSTFSGNTATSGGALLLDTSSFTMSNSILAGDTPSECVSTGVAPCPTNGSGGNVVGGTVALAALGWYGGITPTMVPLPGSGAIRAGAATSLSTDQRGFARPTTGSVDAGAVQTNYLIVTTLTDQVDGSPNCTSGTGNTCSLRDAVTLAGTSPNTNGADITFASALTGTIDLSTVNTSLAQVTGDLNLMGPGASSLTISGGNSTSVGTIFVIGSAAQMAISGVTLANGKTNGYGGAIYNNGSLTLGTVWVSNNFGGQGGAGIYENTGSLYVVNSTVTGNSTNGIGWGGGLTISGGPGVVTNSTFTGNNSAEWGGGILEQDSAVLTVSNSTVVGNYASYGSDLAAFTGMTVMNSVVYDCGNFTCTNGSNGNVVVGNSNLAPLGNYGGPTETMLPLPGSPAICAALPSLDAGILTDQRGFARLNTTYPGYTIGNPPCADAGAVQTNYQSVQFLQTGYSGLPGGPIDNPTQPVVTVTENNQNIGAVPITLSLSGTPTYTHGLGPVTTVAGAGASFDSLIVSPGGDYPYTLSTAMNVFSNGISSLTLSANTDLSIANIPATTSAISAPTITYGSVAYVTVTVSSTGGTPTGDVSLSVAGGSPITQALSGGAATFALTGLNAGTYSLNTSYLPQNGWGGSYATSALLVNKAVPTFSNLSSPTITGGSSPTTFSGTLNANANGQLVPPGENVTISFTVSQLAALDGSDQFSTSIATVAVDPDNTYTVTYSYGGDSNFFPATGTGTLTVTPGSTCTVTDNSDDPSDTGSLRYCVNNASNGEQINFNPPLTGGNTITLNPANGPLAITKNITIAGPGSSQVTVSGGNAVGVFTVNSSVTATISGLTISNGSATNGGGIYINNGHLTVKNCTFTGNQASSDGGAIYSNANPGSFTVTNSTFTNNTATSQGGAIWAQGTFTISGSTFTGNSATAVGGGIFANGFDRPYTVESSTIWGNTATSGADIYNSNALNAFNDVLQNCIQRGGRTCAATINGVNGDYVGSAPNLAPLGWYGGSTQTMPPLPGSPAICAGNTSNLDAFVSTDQRGFARLNTTYTGYSGSNPCLDAGSVQTNYQSVQFTNVPDSGYYSADVNQNPSPAPIVSVTENGQNIGGVPVTLSFTGTGVAGGLGPVTTVAGAGPKTPKPQNP